MPTRYFIRSLKAVLLFLVMALALFAVAYYASAQKDTLSFWALLQASNPYKILLFLGVFGFVYPFIGYTSQRIPRHRDLTDSDREAIIRIFAQARYVQTQAENGKWVFRHVSSLVRFTRVYEDAIEVSVDSNPMLLEGLRRDAFRIARAIEHHLRQSAGPEEEPGQ
jgi:hypothetical protein